MKVVAALSAVLWALSATGAAVAVAEVRIGKNVRVGGNPIAPQTFNEKRRGLYVIHEGKPANPGCTWRANADGSRTQVCHLQRRQQR